MDPQSKTKRVYIVTILVFIAIVVLGTAVHLWRGDDYKFLLILFILITIALRLDEIYNELAASKTKSSDMYLLDTRMQTIIESLEILNHNVEKLTYSQSGGQSAPAPEGIPEQELY